MNILCCMFGHRSMDGIYGGAQYHTVHGSDVDGIGRVHLRLYAKCPRCGKHFASGVIHQPAYRENAFCEDNFQ